LQKEDAMKGEERMSCRMAAVRKMMLALCLVSLGAVPMVAQDAGSSTQQQDEAGQPGGRPSMDQMVDRQLQHLTRALNLSADQQTQIKPILKEQMSQMMTLRQNTEMAPADKQQQMAQIHTGAQGKIRAVLTGDQPAKYDALLAEQLQHMGRHHGGGYPDGSTPPPQ
jgi:protein CpxP